MVIKDILINRFQLDGKQANQLAKISNGSIERASLLSSANSLEKKDWLVGKLLQLELDDNLTFSKELSNEWHIQDVEVLEEKRSHIKELVFSFLMYYRDLLICKMGNDNLPLYHINWKDALVLKSRALSEEALFGILKEIRTSLEYLDRNANITLLLESMITKILYFQAGCVRSIHLEN
jgi:DNA polymerase-3 subunit delta'